MVLESSGNVFNSSKKYDTCMYGRQPRGINTEILGLKGLMRILESWKKSF